MIINLSDYPAIKLTDNEKIDIVANRILKNIVELLRSLRNDLIYK